MKKCRLCDTEKTYESFHRDRSTKDGYESRCKECNARRAKEYRLKNPDYKEKLRESRKNNPEKHKAYDRKYREINKEEKLKKRREHRKENAKEFNRKEYERRKKDPNFLEKQRKINKRYYEKNKEKMNGFNKIHTLVRYAVKLGVITRSKICEICGSDKKIEGHHEDYSKPLGVQWLCKMCHSQKHSKYKEI